MKYQQPSHPPPIPKRPNLAATDDAGIEITNVKDGEIVHQRFLLVNGRAGLRNAQFQAPITVACNDFPTTSWPCVNSHFKALVHLLPGPNTITLIFQQTAVIHLRIQYMPLLQNPPLFLCIFMAQDSPGTFDVPPEKRHENTLAVAVEKLRMAGYMWQAFCAEQMYRNGMGRRTFRLDESWLPDTVSTHEQATRQTAQVHIIRSKHTLKEIRDIRRAQQSPNRDDSVPSLFSYFLDDLSNHPRFGKQPCVVAGLILDAHWDTSKQTVLAHAALGGGGGNRSLGIFGSHLTHAWPRNIEEIVPCMMDTTPTDTRYVANDANESGQWWRALNIGMGAMLHEVGHAYTLSHTASGIMSRGYNNWNRTFAAKEPGRAPIPPEDEAGSHWHRVDIVRLRFLPAFRLPSDGPVGKPHPMGPSFIPLDQEQIELSAPAGLSMVELIVNGRYRTHFEYVDADGPVQQLLLSLQQLKQQCNCKPNECLRLEATTKNQQTEVIDDVDRFLREHTVQLPGIQGVVVKSDGLGHRGLGGTESMAVFHHGYSHPQKQLICVRVHHGTFLDGLVFRWSDGSETLIGKRGGGSTEFYMQSGEFVSGFVVRSGAWVDGLQIKTTTGRSSPWFGGQGGGMHVLEAPQGYVIVGMYASAAAWMDQLGIFYQKCSA
ncbi:putative peptidase family-domain-containing protein [Zychaea mexicana]|uniref:putative peptidase family-domain-containing protein n=1 Tax=Zychaea mexicana TaxID=64656 RepID=UPI0022FDF2A5|nr:putative peptidase family-domain-containing protein [Zychaea mexicana]KAI9493023.1 putative peptidase family-domain-containing protein [Zychaea mexicana]